jgi:hypothetical protein
MEAPVSAPLDPRVIEREISRIREKEANPYSAGTKTNLFTLLVFREPGAVLPGAADPVDAALQHLLGKRPARIITLARADAAATEAWVTGRCFPDRRNRGVCFEEVRIETGRDGLGADPGAWGPLLIRDLPVFAWCPDGLPEREGQWASALRDGAGLIDKLLVDSANATLASARRLEAAFREAFPVSDFSWLRTRVLREQAARAFDPGPMRLLLARLRAVGMRGGAPAEAGLLFAWLEARLGRTLAGEHAAAGSLAEGFTLTFRIDGAPDLEIGCTKGGCLSRGEEKGAYRFPTDGEILLAEVDSLGSDPVFTQALAHADAADG